MWTLCTAVLCRLLDTGMAVGWRTSVEAEKIEIVLQLWIRASTALADFLRRKLWTGAAASKLASRCTRTNSGRELEAQLAAQRHANRSIRAEDSPQRGVNVKSISAACVTGKRSTAYCTPEQLLYAERRCAIT